MSEILPCPEQEEYLFKYIQKFFSEDRVARDMAHRIAIHLPKDTRSSTGPRAMRSAEEWADELFFPGEPCELSELGPDFVESWTKSNAHARWQNIEVIKAIQADASAVPEGRLPEWKPVAEAPQDGTPVEVTVLARFMPYKPGSQQFKNGIKGRWQKHNSYGWENMDEVPEHFIPAKIAKEGA
jgi:hypothetical protein